jgi:putative salt-induced outer membrane protein YdiY
MRRTPVLSILFFVLFTSPVFADQVVLKNGDKLTGTIVDSDTKTLTLKSEFVGHVQDSGFVGEVKIQWDAIQSITSSQPLNITSKDGQTLVGTVATADGKFAVQTANSGEVAVAKDVVQNVRNKDAQAAYDAEIERLRHPKLTDFWGGFIDTGFALARGNTQTLTFNLSGQAARTTEKDKLGLYVLSLYSNNSATGKSVTTASLVGGGGRLELNINDKWFAFGQLGLLHDRFQQLDLRVVPAIGIGYHAVKTEATTFDLSLGGSLNQEYFTNSISRTSGEVLLGEALRHKFSKVTTFDESLQFFPNLTDTGEFRYVFNMGLNTTLTKVLSWQITATNLYLSNPIPGTKTTDLVLTTGLRFTFGKPL